MVDSGDGRERRSHRPPFDGGEEPSELSPSAGPERPPAPDAVSGQFGDSDSADADGYETRYEPGRDDSLVCVVVDAVATVAGCDPLEVEPLYDRLDPEALETLFASQGSAGARAGTVSFPVHDHVVTVVDGDRVRVEPGEWNDRHA